MNRSFEFQKIYKERLIFTGTFQRLGSKDKGRNLTVLLSDLKDNNNDNGKMYGDHVWLNRTQSSKIRGLKKGVRVKFEARVQQYKKKSGRIDYRLSHPTKFVIIESNNNNNNNNNNEIVNNDINNEEEEEKEIYEELNEIIDLSYSSESDFDDKSDYFDEINVNEIIDLT